MIALAEAGRSHALLADGTIMTIRPAGPGDYEAVKRLHEAMSPDNLYLRFFSMSRVAAENEARRVCREGGPDHGALLGLLGEELVGVASYELIPGLQTAEIALAVADGMHERGIATLLLEHMVSLARARGVRVLTAEALPENSAVLRLLADSGLAVRRKSGTAWLNCPCRCRRTRPSARPAPTWTRWPAGTNMRMRPAWNLCWLPGRPRWSARSAVPDQ